MTPGPNLQYLMRRLAECPPDFLAAPRAPPALGIDVRAIAADLLRRIADDDRSPPNLEVLTSHARGDANRLQLVSVACWLLADGWFAGRRELLARTHGLLRDRLAPLAGAVRADKFVLDAERREELVRYCLHALDLVPEGETEAHAQDRLVSLSSVERQRLIAQTRAAHAHARQVREAMAKKAAEEAAAKVSRE